MPGPFLCQRKPATTQSAVRACLTLIIARLPARYGASRRLAITPSRPAPSKRRNQSSRQRAVARGGREVDRRRRRRRAPPRAARGVRASGVSRRSSSPSASRSQATNDAGDLRGEQLHARRGRMDAQEQRLEVEPVRRRRSRSRRRARSAPGSAARERLDELGEVAVQRLLVAALEQDLVAVAEDERAEAVPLRLEEPAVAVGEVVRGVESIGASGGAKGSVTAPS